MEEGLTKLIFRMAVTILFLSAIAVFLMLNFKTQALTKVIQDNLVSPKVLSDKTTGNVRKYTTGAQIVSSIMNVLETDIKVDGTDIPKTVDIYSFNYASIDASVNYDVSFSIDDNGVITKVIYIKV